MPTELALCWALGKRLEDLLAVYSALKNCAKKMKTEIAMRKNGTSQCLAWSPAPPLAGYVWLSAGHPDLLWVFTSLHLSGPQLPHPFLAVPDTAAPSDSWWKK